MVETIMNDAVAIASGIAAIASIAISIIVNIKKVSATKAKNALEFLNQVHDLANQLIVEYENSPYKGKDKKNAVIAAVVSQIEGVDKEELSQYIDMQVALTREVNAREKVK